MASSASFKDLVFEAVKLIKPGKVATYSGLAQFIDRPNSARAVGLALGKNKKIYKIPCHRVIRSNGVVGGFALGNQAKINKLKEEGVEVEGGRVVNFKRFLYNFKK